MLYHTQKLTQNELNPLMLAIWNCTAPKESRKGKLFELVLAIIFGYGTKAQIAKAKKKNPQVGL